MTTHIYRWSGEALCGVYSDVGEDLIEVASGEEPQSSCLRCQERLPLAQLAQVELE